MCRLFRVRYLAQRLFFFNTARYIIVSGLAFLIFYVLLKDKISFKKLQLKYPTLTDYKREILYSIGTIVIFVIVGLTVFATPLRAHTMLYENFGDHSWSYWFLSIFLMIILHDAYFYWTHRAMHHPTLFKWIHLVHHKSTNPSPWASYAFHPLEGFVEAGIIIPIAFFIPFHLSALFVFLLFMMFYNVYGHLGFEIFPAKLHTHPIGKYINTSIDHNVHHKYFKGNYGLYFLFWDRWMGTYSDKSEVLLAEVEGRKAMEETSVFETS